MKKFLAVYYVPAAALKQMQNASEADRKAGMDAWMKWMTANKKSVVDSGAPLGKTKRISKEGVESMKNEIGAYTIVQADSHDDAAELFDGHPHIMLLPGGTIEVMEFLDIPGMVES